MSDHGPDQSAPLPPPPPPPLRPPGAGSWAAPPPPSPPPGGAQRTVRAAPGRGRVVVGVALAVLVAMIAVGAAAMVSHNKSASAVDATTAATTSAAAPRPSTGQTSGPTGSGGSGAAVAPSTSAAKTDFDRTIDAIIAFDEKERGLKFKTRPMVVALSEADFVARYQAETDDDYAKHKADFESATVVMSAVGLLKPGVSYYETTKAFGSAGVLGFYDPKTKELSVRGNKLTPFVRTVVAHELTHALDDQWFGLDRPQYDDAKDEISFGLSALAEGNARRVENAYRASLSAGDQAKADSEEASYGGAFQANQFTPSFLKLQLAPYSLGEKFVGELLNFGGQKALDAAFNDPPTTSEEVINVDKYLAKEGRVNVTPPPADGALVDDGVMGEIVIQYLLESAISSAQANQAAAGWSGDWYVAWTANGISCVRTAIQMDTPKDTSDLKSAFDKWVSTRPKASVTSAANTVTVTSCTK